MTDFKVKYEKKLEIKDPVILKFIKGHKGWLVLAGLGIFIVFYYTIGWVIGLFVFLILALLLISASHIYDLVKWIRTAEDEQQQLKRVLTLSGIALGLGILYAVVKYAILPTEFGQNISSFIWRQF